MMAVAVVLTACSQTPTGPSNNPTTATQTQTQSGTVTVGRVTWSCVTSAAPLPGWRNCTGTVALTITRTISSGYVSAYFQYPDSGSFFHGDLQVGTAVPGAVTVNVVNEYVSRCANPFATMVDIYNGPQNAQSAPLLVSTPVTLTGC